MTGLAQGYQIRTVMRAALGDRNDVVDFLNRRQPPIFQAHLTQRMLRHISVTDSLPGPAVFFVDVRCPFIFVVTVSGLLFVNLTVLLSVHRKSRTAQGSARSSWFSRHTAALLLQSQNGASALDMKKSLGVLPRRLWLHPFSDNSILPHTELACFRIYSHVSNLDHFYSSFRISEIFLRFLQENLKFGQNNIDI